MYNHGQRYYSWFWLCFTMLNSAEHVNVKTIILSLYLRFKRSMVLEMLCDTQYLSK